jgi:PAT family beta-lactamase induction signal transducer AmpG
LIGSILGLGTTDPETNLAATAAWSVLVAFFSASQDVVIDAFRVELLTAEEQPSGAAATQLGYRLGMLASGAGGLFAAAYLGWHAAYHLMAAAVLVGSVTALMLPDRAAVSGGPSSLAARTIAPFRDFATRPAWLLVLLFVLLYNLNDALVGNLSTTFYLRLGFTLSEIASISKIFGLAATLAGIAVGAAVTGKVGLFRALLLLGIAKLTANLLYLVQLHAGHDLRALTLTIGAENFAAGAASSAFIAYLARLCAAAHTATQYALLSAIATLGRTVLASGSGALAQYLGWGNFFVLAAACGVPALIILRLLDRISGGAVQERSVIPATH